MTVPVGTASPRRRDLRLYVLLTGSAAALALGAGALAAVRSRAMAAADGSRPDDPFQADRHVVRGALQFFVVPLWIGAGVADWLCHRRSRIENTTGLPESLLHILQMTEAGGAILTGMFVEVNPQVLAGLIATFFLHEATAMWDVSYAVTAREVTPVEQHVHSFLEMVPLLAVTLIAIEHWPQLLVLAGTRRAPPQPLAWKRDPVGTRYALISLAAMIALEIVPYVEEALRDRRARRPRAPRPL